MLQSVQTALLVFETVARRQPIGVSEIARHLKISKSTAQRCLNSLHENGWIKTDGERPLTRWIITAKALSIGRHVAENGNLREIAVPVMEKLWRATEESIHLVVAEERRAVLLERLETPKAVRLFLPLGGSAPLHTTASGKVILAYFDEKSLEQYIAQGLEALTEHTIKNPDELRADLAQIKKRGYAIAIDEVADGASAMASPIFGRQGRAIASLVISCPTARLPKSIRGEYARLLVEGAGDISSRLNS